MQSVLFCLQSRMDITDEFRDLMNVYFWNQKKVCAIVSAVVLWLSSWLERIFTVISKDLCNHRHLSVTHFSCYECKFWMPQIDVHCEHQSRLIQLTPCYRSKSSKRWNLYHFSLFWLQQSRSHDKLTLFSMEVVAIHLIGYYLPCVT